MNGLSYGKRITKARMDARLTQAELAEDIEVKRETLSRWERDMLKVTPPAEEMHRLVARLPDLTEVELLYSLHYNLSGLTDAQGRPLTLEGRQALDSLSAQELDLIEDFRRLEPAIRHVIAGQVRATRQIQEQRPPRLALRPARRHPETP